MGPRFGKRFEPTPSTLKVARNPQRDPVKKWTLRRNVKRVANGIGVAQSLNLVYCNFVHIHIYIYIYISLETPPIPPKNVLSFPQATHFSSSPARWAGFARSDFLESPHGGDSHRCGVEVKDIGRDAIEDHEAQDHDCKVLGIFQYFLDPRV